MKKKGVHARSAATPAVDAPSSAITWLRDQAKTAIERARAFEPGSAARAYADGQARAYGLAAEYFALMAAQAVHGENSGHARMNTESNLEVFK